MREIERNKEKTELFIIYKYIVNKIYSEHTKNDFVKISKNLVRCRSENNFVILLK